VRRVTGKTIGAFVRDEIAKPLSADFFIGLPESEDKRTAEMIGPKRQAEVPPLSDIALMALINPQQNPEMANRREWRAAEIPAANGQSTAMGLARLYAALAGDGSLDGKRILSSKAIGRMTMPATTDGRQDMFLGFTDAWGMGVALNRPGIYGTNARAFGHSGWGGSFGCADPDARVSIGYVCNQMGAELVGDPRTSALCGSVLSAAASQ